MICFDEAQSLTDLTQTNQTQSYLSELLPAIGELRTLPFFSVFVATGRIERLHENPWPLAHWHARSERTQVLKMHIFPPITEVAFDEFAVPAGLDGKWTLDRLASTHHIAHLGRVL